MDTFGPQYLLFLCPPLEQGVIQRPYNTHNTDEYQMKSSEKMKNSLSKLEFKESMANSEFD